VEYQNYFDFYTIPTLIRSRKVRFLYKLTNPQNKLCEFCGVAEHEEINIISYSQFVIALIRAFWQLLLRHLELIRCSVVSFLFCFMFVCLSVLCYLSR